MTEGDEVEAMDVVEGDNRIGDNDDSSSDGEEDFDTSVYEIFHEVSLSDPCLSFSILEDDLGFNRAKNMCHTMYLAAGTQAKRPKDNRLLLLKLSNLKKLKKKKDFREEELSDSSSDESDDDSVSQPKMNCVGIKQQSSNNRIKSVKIQQNHLVSNWSERGQVLIYNVTNPLRNLEDQCTSINQLNPEPIIHKPVYLFSGHSAEGFALDWSHVNTGYLASGDTKGAVHIWEPINNSTWDVKPYLKKGHNASVEDIQWSPTEANVIASCSVDCSIRIWDLRSSSTVVNVEDAHSQDVNVISWNRREPLLLSGGDDGFLKVWDLRQFKAASDNVAEFSYHQSPITSVEWHPTDSSAFVASSEDNKITLWDLAVERDNEAEGFSDEEDSKIPPQLLFVHEGQKSVKEVHWHPQIEGVVISTALNGLNVFKSINF